MTHKLLVILAISVLHILVIFSLLTQKNSKVNRSPEQVILLNLFHPKVPKRSDDDKLITGFLHIKKLDAKIRILDINMRAIIIEDDRHDENSKTRLDLRFQYTVEENNSIPIDRKGFGFNSWASPDGTQFVEVGDGECITSMQKLPNTGRGTSWSSSRVKCGKSESERMMENVERGLKRKR
jgi:hypothetical protein